jgi:SNF family Na+-dependent transporter
MSHDPVMEEWRDLWSFKADYIFVCIAYIFTLNNLGTIQDDISEYGGGVYALAYLASLLVVCLPLLMMELATGQLTARSPFEAIGRLCPIFKGVGLGFIVLSLMVAALKGITAGYYGIYLVHLFMSIGSRSLPWQRCDNYWNTPDCTAPLVGTNGTPSESILFNALPDPRVMGIAASEFYTRYVQNASETISVPGDLVWRPIAASGAVWVLVCIAIVLGVRWLGKVCYFTVLIPLILLLGLTLRALTFDRMEDHIVTLFKTDWDQFLNKEMWAAAFSKSLLGVGLCFGSYITLGSYNKRSNNMVGDSCFLMLLHILFLGAEMFTSVGLDSLVPLDQKNHLSFDPILGLMLAGAGRTKMWHLWSALLLIVVLFLTLNTMYVLAFTALAALEDSFLSHLGSRILPRMALAFLVCCFGFALGLGYTVQSGPHAHKLVIRFFDIFPYWVLLVFEIFAVAWFYCGHVLGRDIRQMVKNACCWCSGSALSYVLYLLPVVPVYILVMKLWNYTSPVGEHVYATSWAEPIAWLVALLPVLLVPLLMVYVVTLACLKGPGISHWEKFKCTIISPLRYEVVKARSTPPRYTSASPGYVLIPNVPLAEPEMYHESEYGERTLRVSNI